MCFTYGCKPFKDLRVCMDSVPTAENRNGGGSGDTVHVAIQLLSEESVA